MHPKKTLTLILFAFAIWGTTVFFSNSDLKFGQSNQLEFEQTIRDPFENTPEEETPDETPGSSGAGGHSSGGKQGISTVSTSISVDSEGTVTDGGDDGLTQVSMQSPDAAFELSVPVGVEIAVVGTEENYSEGVLSAPTLLGETSLGEQRGYVRITEIYEVGGDSSLMFSEPITLTFKLPGNKALIAPAIFYYDENQSEWVDIGGALFFDSEDDLAIKVDVLHLTKFTVFDKDLLSHPFTDLDNNWARNYVADLWRQGVIQGRDPHSFAPNSQITRAEFTKIMLLLFHYQVPTVATKAIFSDVEGNEWYAPYLEQAYEEGVVIGFTDGTFRPNSYITRAEALSILFKAAKVEVVRSPVARSFPDVGKAEWFTDYINFGVENHVVDGYQNGLFGPLDHLTRAEAAKIGALGVPRMMKLLGKEGY